MPNKFATMLIAGLTSAASVSLHVGNSVAQTIDRPSLDRQNQRERFVDARSIQEFDQQLSAISRSFQLQPLQGIDESPVVTAMAISANDDLLVAAGDDHAVRVVKLDSLTTVATLQGHVDWVQSVQISSDGKFIVSVGNDHDVWIWQRAEDGSSDPWQGTPIFHADNALYAVAIHPGDSKISFGGFGPKIWTIDLAKLAVESGGSPSASDVPGAVSVYQCDCPDQRVIKVTSDGQAIVSAGRDGMVRVWDIRSSRHLQKIQLHKSRIRAMALSGDDSVVSTVGEDRRLVRYDLAAGNVIAQQRMPGGKLFSMCQPANDILAIGSSDNSLRLFSITADREIARLVGHDGTIAVICYGNKHLATGSHDTSIRIWQLDETLKYTTTSAGSTAAAENHSNAPTPRVR